LIALFFLVIVIQVGFHHIFDINTVHILNLSNKIFSKFVKVFQQLKTHLSLSLHNAGVFEIENIQFIFVNKSVFKIIGLAFLNDINHVDLIRLGDIGSVGR